MVTALPNDEVNKILLYHAMPNSWRKKMTEQRHNYLDRSIQEISGFFETRKENLESPAPPLAVRSLTRKKKKKNPKCEDYDKIPQTTRTLQVGRNSISIMGNAVILQANDALY